MSKKTPERVTPYPKIDTLFDRREDGTVNLEQFRRPEFKIPREWLVTEKLDGTNIRVSLEIEHQQVVGGIIGADRWVLRYYGRSADAQLPPFLLEHLQKTFPVERMKSLWRCKNKSCTGIGTVGHSIDCPKFEPYPIVLYGEGYGAKIQGGGEYRKEGDVSFRLFDTLVAGKYWLGRSDVVDVARQLFIQPVPQINPEAYGVDLQHILFEVRKGIRSVVSEKEGIPRLMEGVVAFTDPPLFNTRGQQLKFKLKTKDFVAGKRR